MKLAIHNIKGKETAKKIDLNNDVFAFEPNDQAIYLDVKQYLAAQRTGTHKTKGRSDVKGSRRKIRKQKGSGAARVGDIKNPLFRGGGRVFGPRPRSYSFKLNKNLKRLARKSALSTQAKDKNIVVVENFSFETAKTKNFTEVLKAFGVENSKSLFVLGNSDNNVYLSSRNLKKTTVITSDSLSTYGVLNTGKVILSEGALEGIESNLSK